MFMIFTHRQHVQTKGAGTSPFEETVETLDNMEAFTLKLLMDIVTNITEVVLQINHKYFVFLNFRMGSRYANFKTNHNFCPADAS